MSDLEDLLSLTAWTEIYVGRQQEPVEGTVPSGGTTYVLGEPVPSNSKGLTIEIFAAANDTIQVCARSRSGNTFTKIGTSFVSVPVTAGQKVTVSLSNFDFPGGSYISLYAPNSSMYRSVSTEDNAGWYLATGGQAGNPTSFTDAGGVRGKGAPGSRLEVRVKVSHIDVKPVILDTIEGVPATGYDTIVQRWTNNGVTKAAIGFQNVDDQDPQAGFFRVFATQHDSHYDFSTYQYGVRLSGFGELGETMELQLASDTTPTKPVEFSVRHRVGGPLGANLGARIQARNSPDTVGLYMSYQNDADPHFGIENNEDTPLSIGLYHPKDAGAIRFAVGMTEPEGEEEEPAPVERVRIDSTSLFIANSDEPATPTGGVVIWADGGSLKVKGSDGTVTVLALP